MKKTIDLSEFVRGFADCNREDNFSRSGLEALFYHLEEFEEDTGRELEFDCIALCCDYTEYESLDEFHKEHDKDEYPDLDSIREETEVIEVDDSAFIICVF